MIVKFLRVAVAGVFVALLWAPVQGFAGEAEWQAHMKAGIAAYQRGDYRGASAALAAALKEAEAFGERDERLAITLNNLASTLQRRGRYAEAELLYRRSLQTSEKALGPDHPDVGTTLNNLAGLYDDQRRYAEAEPLYKRGLTIYEKARGPVSVLTLFDVLAISSRYEIRTHRIREM